MCRSDFISKSPISANNLQSLVTNTFEQNFIGEQCEATELTYAMSRANLLQKIKKETGLSVSPHINQISAQEALMVFRNFFGEVSEALQLGSEAVACTKKVNHKSNIWSLIYSL